MNARISSDKLRSFVFGVEDSLVSTVGLVSGIAVADVPKETLLITGTILIFVEAFSMSVGALLSDNSAKEYDSRAGVPLSSSVSSSLVMFFSYFLSGFLILAPYLMFYGAKAVTLSVVVALLALFTLGAGSAKIIGLPSIRKGITMAVVGGLAVFVGIGVGALLK